MNWKKPVFMLGAVLLCTSLLMADTPSGITATATQIAPVSANSAQAVLPDPVKVKAQAKAQAQAVTGPMGLAPAPGAKPVGVRSGEECPPDALFGQIPHGPDDSWSFATSGITTSFTYLVQENYSGATGEICDIHWWGLSLFWTGAGWSACDPTGVTFDVVFYADNGGVPGDVVCTYTGLTPVVTGTGLFYAGYEMYYFEILSLNPCCSLTDGWVSVQSQMSDADCALLWASSPQGDGDSLQGGAPTGYDRALCLTGEYIPQFGACCDDFTGVCEDNVELINCDGRFTADTLCADIVPPCGITGACCVDLVCTATTFEADCAGEWYEGETCPEFVCPDTNADFIVQAPFTSELLNTCGQGNDCALRSTEEHEYEVIIPTAGVWNFNTCLDSSWDTYIYLGSTQCTQDLGYNDDSCGLQSEIELWLEPGNYFCTIEGYSTCGNYIFDVYDATPTGACCVDLVCVETNLPAECDALGGEWYQGETCPAFECPAPCEESTIIVTIATDSWPSETTWEIVPHGGGAPICSGGPYSEDYATYETQCCIGYADCVDFYIYDAYGDGIYSPGGYMIELDGEVIYTCIGAGWSGSQESVMNFGGGCVPDTGACCVDLVCVATNTEDECDALGGDWFIFQVCPDFVCPEIPDNDDCENAEPVNAPYPVTIMADNSLATIDCPGLLDWIAIWYAIELPYASNNVDVQYCPTAVDIYTVGIILMDDCACDDYIISSYEWIFCDNNLQGFHQWWDGMAGPGTILLPAYVVDAAGAGMQFEIVIDVTEDLPCVVECPAEGIPEAEPCGSDTNGGCNMTDPTFEPIACNTTICGTGWFDGGTRDTDWFELVIDQSSVLTISLEAEFAALFGKIGQYVLGVPGCDNTTGSVDPYGLPGECQPMTIVTDCLPAGTYYIFVAPQFADIVSCPADYVLTVECEPCLFLGACCYEEGEEILCVDNEVQDCDALGGTWYSEEECATFQCPQPCDESQIDITILTDSWGSETTWEVTDHATGVVICSGGPYASNTMYYETCCIAFTDCVDFTIYDSYGDGIYAPGGYIVVVDGVEVANTMGGGFTGSIDTVMLLGGGCPAWACCVDEVCVDNTSPTDCAGLGGLWYEGELCPDFECPSCEYCTPCYSNIDDDFITNVTFNTINNDTVSEGSPCSYGDYTSLSTDVEPGETYQLSVSVDGDGSWTQYVTVWFDFNGDCIFEMMVQVGTVYTDPGNPQTTTADITIPADVPMGPARMRVIERYSTWTTDPCEVYTYGEAEDYTVVVVPGICGDFDLDGDVDVDDFYFFLDAFGSCEGDLKYEEACDFDGDGCITLVDYQTWMACYREANGKDFVVPLGSHRAISRPGGQQAPRRALMP